MKLNTKTLLVAMNILAWVVFVGFLVIAGSIATSYIVSISHQQASKDLYKGLDLSAYRQYSFMQYSFVVWYKVILYVAQAYTAFLMTSLLSAINIARPFNADVVKLMQKIAYAILCLWLVAVVHNIHIAVLEKTAGIAANYVSGDSIFLAAIVYILAQLFKIGAAIQSENELTV
ncbi:MAG TPA: DUF2975 domain-containing protein [Puia sp.]|nr:DUF2975 domain-containing protein [Puia sp.]